MSTSSGAVGTPSLPGYTVTWDVTTGAWVARADSFDTELRGKNQAELDAARWHHVVQLANELAQILRDAPSRAYSRHWWAYRDGSLMFATDRDDLLGEVARATGSSPDLDDLNGRLDRSIARAEQRRAEGME